MRSFNAKIIIAVLCLTMLALSAYAEKSGSIQAIHMKLDVQAQTINIENKVKVKPNILVSNTYVKSASAVKQGGEDIASAVPIASIPATLTGTTAGYADDYDVTSGGCTSTNAPDVVYSLVPDDDYRIHILSCNSAYWTKLIVYETDETNNIACSQYSDSCLPDYRAALYNIDVTGGTTYYIVVDGGIAGPSGAYEIDILVLPATDELELHPGITGTGDGPMTMGTEYYEYDTMQVWYSSDDNGASFNDATGWVFEGMPNYPSGDLLGGTELEVFG